VFATRRWGLRREIEVLCLNEEEEPWKKREWKNLFIYWRGSAFNNLFRSRWDRTLVASEKGVKSEQDL
jgi:hypothetical protein